MHLAVGFYWFAWDFDPNIDGFTAFTLILYSTTCTRPECAIALDLVAARFGLAGLLLQRKLYSDLLIFASKHLGVFEILLQLLPLSTIFFFIALNTQRCGSQSSRSEPCPDAAWDSTMACWTVVCRILVPHLAWEELAGGAPGEWSGLPASTVKKIN